MVDDFIDVVVVVIVVVVVVVVVILRFIISSFQMSSSALENPIKCFVCLSILSNHCPLVLMSFNLSVRLSLRRKRY